jgi:hypothetical protein
MNFARKMCMFSTLRLTYCRELYPDFHKAKIDLITMTSTTCDSHMSRTHRNKNESHGTG